MSNVLYVRRVRVQEIDARGQPVGKPEYGVLASDNYEQAFQVGQRSLRQLNREIRAAGNILDFLGGFDDLSRDGIGTANYFGAAVPAGAAAAAADE